MENILLDEAAVFVAGENYDIIWNTSVKGLAYVTAGGKTYFDAINGNIKSEETVHKVTVPKDVLDNAGEYTVFFRESYERRAYFATSSDELFKKTYRFSPVPRDSSEFKFYLIADTHCADKYASLAANNCGKALDFLVLGGDIPDSSSNFESIRTIFRICASVTHGEIPVVSMRGNHDTRGLMAPDYCKYSPTVNGEMYYTFTLGRMFGIVLDCGEDKPDDHPEYGGMAAFEPYRKTETEFLEKAALSGEYKKYDRTVIFCHERIDAHNHIAFKDFYKRWAELLNDIRPDVMIDGHEHCCAVFEKGHEYFDTGLALDFPTVVGSQCRGNKRTNNADKPEGFTGTLFEFSKERISYTFTDDKGAILGGGTL